ncbi:GGDEF domain-containing protein [Thermotoga petrophila]|uniref:GGDEF domain-containing protein n=1 Tax=Thermotoga petrophila TaxID=93929 RepID=UPI0002E4E3BC|nr:GGDEF domain-containing protein [Thermotoga petrophila]
MILYLKRPLSKDALLLIQTLLTTFEREDLSFGIKELEYMAYHDPLTGLPNRRYLFELGNKYLDLAKREGKKAFVLFLDLAGFKAINDTYGHLTGDEVLKTVSRRILDRVRRSDVVARYGGDEFTILLYDMKEEYLKFFLERILSTFREPIRVGNTTLTVASNIGVARFPEDGENLEELLKVADMRMYRAKEMRTPYLLRS